MVQEQLQPLYFLSRKKGRSDGKCPIWARVTLNGKRREFSTGQFVVPEHWDNELKMVTGGTKSTSVPINNALSRTTREIGNLYILLSSQSKDAVTAKMVVQAYKPERTPKQEDKDGILTNFSLETQVRNLTAKCVAHFKQLKKVEKQVPGPARDIELSALGQAQEKIRKEIETVAEKANRYFTTIEKKEITIREAMQEFLLQFLRRVMAGTRQLSTYKKWLDTTDKLQKFCSYHLKRRNVPLSEIRPWFGEKLYDYLTIVARCGNNNAMKHIKNFKQVLDQATTNEWINVNPLKSYKCSYIEPEPDSVFMEDVLKLIYADSLDGSEEIARDAFLVEIFTGYAYAELYALKTSNLITGMDGRQWLSIDRGKTNHPETVPVMQIVAAIIEKYENHPRRTSHGFLFPVFCAQYYNRLLKRIAKKLGIGHDLHSHVGRHTFATTILLENDVPLPTVGKMLGQRSIRVTERYAKVSKKNISRHVERVEGQLFSNRKEKAQDTSTNIQQQAVRAYMFSIGQPFVHEQDGCMVAEFADGRLLQVG